MDALMVNIIAVVIIVAALFAAVRYIYTQKKKGAKCIGCPEAGSCQKKNLNLDV